MDAFGILVHLMCLWPRPSSVATDFFHAAQFMFVTATAQVMLQLLGGGMPELDEDDAVADDVRQQRLAESRDFLAALAAVFEAYQTASTISAVPALTVSARISTYIRSLYMPFLRRAALFQLACLEVPTGPPTPPVVTAADQPLDAEFDGFCDLLRIPPSLRRFADAIVDPSVVALVVPTLKDLAVGLPDSSALELQKHVPRLALPIPFRLQPLPDLYHDLLQRYSRTKCKNCNQIPPTKALCLICGTLLCAGSSCCRSSDAFGMGECTRHSLKCGAGLGLFLILKMSVVLVMRGERHSFWGSPYLDEHGEEDAHLIRGRALYFNKERYEQLTQLYVSLRVEYDTRIAETTTIEDTDWY
eukprot:TRINITY_DN14687_c0_g1_i1.p1 TRINITY_DN14687_c0_g1~~TRINITY_DN14687_c0_g1_i1.p1  ORF type:complete len:359 (-),score=132.00 TRINITY_DN14687_c0_g1_i1:235-1311(-)